MLINSLWKYIGYTTYLQRSFDSFYLLKLKYSKINRADDSKIYDFELTLTSIEIPRIMVNFSFRLAIGGFWLLINYKPLFLSRNEGTNK